MLLILAVPFCYFIILIGLNFVGQIFPSNKIFVTNRNFRHFRPTKNFVQWALNRSFTVTFKKKKLDKIFAGQKFRHLQKIFRRTKFSSPIENFRHFRPDKNFVQWALNRSSTVTFKKKKLDKISSLFVRRKANSPTVLCKIVKECWFYSC